MKFQLLRLGREGSERFANLILGSWSRELYADRCHVPVAHVDAVALRAHFDRGIVNRPAIKIPQQLQSFGFDLLFFTADEWNHVVGGVKRSYAWIASARKRLHRGNDTRGNAEFRMQRRQRHHDDNRRTIWIRNDEATL